MTIGAGPAAQPPPPTPGSRQNAQTFGPGPHGAFGQNGWQILFLLVAFTALFIAGLLILSVLNPFGSDDNQTAIGESGVGVAGQSGDREPAGPAADPPVADASGESLRCPVMTDSIDRLYLAFLERPPNEAEFSRSVNRYSSGEADLEMIAEELATSDLFRQRYGPLDNVEFVEQIYLNSHGGPVTEEDLETWVRALDSGRSRGAFAVAVTETRRAVNVSRTTAPMAGFLRQYPMGTHWYCGVGPRDDLPIKPLTEPAVYADYMFHNGGTAVSQAGIKTVVGTRTYLTMASGQLPPGVTSYRWNGLFSGDGNYGSAIDVEAGPSTWWVMVFYPSSIGEGRLGWEIDS